MLRDSFCVDAFIISAAQTLCIKQQQQNVFYQPSIFWTVACDLAKMRAKLSAVFVLYTNLQITN